MAKSRPHQRRLKTELDPERLRVWLAYMRVNLQLTYEMNHQLLAESELSLSDYHVLSKLQQAPGQRLRIAPLARRDRLGTQPSLPPSAPDDTTRFDRH